MLSDDVKICLAWIFSWKSAKSHTLSNTHTSTHIHTHSLSVSLSLSLSLSLSISLSLSLSLHTYMCFFLNLNACVFIWMFVKTYETWRQRDGLTPSFNLPQHPVFYLFLCIYKINISLKWQTWMGFPINKKVFASLIH